MFNASCSWKTCLGNCVPFLNKRIGESPREEKKVREGVTSTTDAVAPDEKFVYK